ncbi:MAG: ParA family protein [Bacilli bacterium]|jgi:chromosome partitioning protein|nr:ParA family protein [Bacilli bacterium]MDY0064193.1 ParA family protein [Bacilli bacterium]
MAVVSTFCKKGGVGKTTFIGYLAHYYATTGKKVLILSVDDQNSVFKLFGEEDKIFEVGDNYLEFLMAGHAELGDVLIEVRENLYIIKTLNTDKLSMKLTLERAQEKTLNYIIKQYSTFFDYIFIDFPPSSSRLTEVLLDMSDGIIVVVGLDSLGLNGFINTIQYFVDNDIDLNNIKYILPNGYSVNRRAPRISLETLQTQAKEFTPNATVLPPLKEKAIIKNIQAEGVSVFDDKPLPRYDQDAKDGLKKDLLELFTYIKM